MVRRVVLGLFFALLIGHAEAQTPPYGPGGGGGGLSPTGNGSSVTVIPTQGTVARTLANIVNDIGSVLGFNLPGTDYSVPINAALAAPGVTARLPLSGSPYAVSNPITFGAGNYLVCDPGVIIQSSATSGNMISVPSGATNSGIRDCILDGTSAGVHAGSIQAVGTATTQGFQWIGGEIRNAGSLAITSAAYFLIQNVNCKNSSSTCMSVNTSSNNGKISGGDFENNNGFGVGVTASSSYIVVDGLHSVGNTIEVVGSDSTTSFITFSNNHVGGTGNNCLSMSGSYGTIIGNFAIGCAFDGIGIFGSFNSVSGNTALNNGQAHNPASPYYNAGVGTSLTNIDIHSGFGGAGQSNTVGSSNTTDDNQTTKTINYGVRISTGYTQWAASTAYTASSTGSYAFNAGIIYQNQSGAGTSGTTAPTCAVGSTCSDGVLTWKGINTTPDGTIDASNNNIGSNTYGRAITAAFADNSVYKLTNYLTPQMPYTVSTYPQINIGGNSTYSLYAQAMGIIGPPTGVTTNYGTLLTSGTFGLGWGFQADQYGEWCEANGQPGTAGGSGQMCHTKLYATTTSTTTTLMTGNNSGTAGSRTVANCTSVASQKQEKALVINIHAVDESTGAGAYWSTPVFSFSCVGGTPASATISSSTVLAGYNTATVGSALYGAALPTLGPDNTNNGLAINVKATGTNSVVWTAFIQSEEGK